MSEKLQMMSKIPQMGIAQVCMIFGVQFIVTIAFLVIAIIYAFTVETDYACEPWSGEACGAGYETGANSCWAPADKDQEINMGDYTSDNLQAYYEDNFNYVSKEFNIVLIIFFVTSLIGFVQMILVILVAVTKSDLINKINQCLNIAGCLGFANLIMMMVFRLRYSGKYCSGDWSLTEEIYEDAGYSEEQISEAKEIYEASKEVAIELDMGLYRRGDMIFILIILIWVLPVAACCLMCCIMAVVIKSMM